MKTLIVSAILLALAGCANLNSIFRKTNTEAGRTETILIDDKQRPITVNRVVDAKPMTCVTRSADALQQLATSASAKIDQASGAGGEVGFASAEQVMSIAFRTQVTEAQQEFLYSLCQLRANGVLSDADVSDNLRHFQNTMLAMVAIDDLASASRPKASTSQPPPSGDATPPTAPDASDPKVQAVKDAQTGVTDAANGVTSAGAKVQSAAKSVEAVTAIKDLDASTKELTGALTTYDGKQKSYAQALSKLSGAVKAQLGSTAKPPSGVTSATSQASAALTDVKTDYKKATDAVTALGKVADVGKLKAAQSDVNSALTDYTTAVGKYETAENSLATALTAWNSSGTSDGTKKKPGNTPQNDDASATASVAVANDVALIVQTIVWQSFVTEGCQKALFQNFTGTALPVQKFCLDHMVRADDVREKQLLGTLAAPKGEPPTAGRPSPAQPLFTPAVTPVVAPTPLFSLHDQPLFEAAVSSIFKKEEAARIAANAQPSASAPVLVPVSPAAPAPAAAATSATPAAPAAASPGATPPTTPPPAPEPKQQ